MTPALIGHHSRGRRWRNRRWGNRRRPMGPIIPRPLVYSATGWYAFVRTGRRFRWTGGYCSFQELMWPTDIRREGQVCYQGDVRPGERVRGMLAAGRIVPKHRPLRSPHHTDGVCVPVIHEQGGRAR